MWFSRQEYCNGLLFPSPGDLTTQGSNSYLLHWQMDSLPLSQKQGSDNSYGSSESVQLCPTLCDYMDYSPPGSSVHGIFQARMLEWVAISFSDNYRKEMPPNWESRTRPFTHNMHFEIALAQGESSWATKTIHMNLEERQISKQIHSSLR